jgi:hypothetical protein
VESRGGADVESRGGAVFEPLEVCVTMRSRLLTRTGCMMMAFFFPLLIVKILY